MGKGIWLLQEGAASKRKKPMRTEYPLTVTPKLDAARHGDEEMKE